MVGTNLLNFFKQCHHTEYMELWAILIYHCLHRMVEVFQEKAVQFGILVLGKDEPVALMRFMGMHFNCFWLPAFSKDTVRTEHNLKPGKPLLGEKDGLGIVFLVKINRQKLG